MTRAQVAGLLALAAVAPLLFSAGGNVFNASYLGIVNAVQFEFSFSIVILAMVVPAG